MSVAGQARHIRGSMELLYDTRQETNILHALIRDAKIKPATVSSRPIGSVNAGPTLTNTNVFTEPIAFHPIPFIIVSDEPDTLRIDKNFGAYSTRVIVTGQGGTDDDISTIVGLDDGEGNTGKAAFAGQLLIIDAALSGDLTLKEGTTFSLPGAVDFVIAAGQNVELIYDSTSDRWQVLGTASDASKWSTFPALTNVDMAGFTVFNIGNLLFDDVVGGVASATNPTIYYDLANTELVIQTQSNTEEIVFAAGNAAADKFARMDKTLTEWNLVAGHEFRMNAVHIFDIAQFDKDVTLLTTTPNVAPFPVMKISTVVVGENNGGDLGTPTIPWNNLNVEQIRLRAGTVIIDIPSITRIGNNMVLNVNTGAQFDWRVLDGDIMRLNSTALALIGVLLNMNGNNIDDIGISTHDNVVFNDSVGGFAFATNPTIYYDLGNTELVIQTNAGEEIALRVGTAGSGLFARMDENIIDYSVSIGSEFRVQALRVFNISQFDGDMVLDVPTPTMTGNPVFKINAVVTDANFGGDLGTSALPWNNLNVEQIRLREGDEIIDISSIATRAGVFRLNFKLNDSLAILENGVIQYQFFNNKLDLNLQYLQFDAQANPGAAPATERFLFADSSNSDRLSIRTPTTTIDLEAPGGGSQTPWTSNIDADGNNLFDLSNIEFRIPTDLAPAGTINAIYADAGGMILNVPATDRFEFSVNDIDAVTFDTSEAIFSVDVVPSGSRNLGASGNNWAGLFLSQWTLATGQTIRSTGAGPDIVIETSTGNDIIFRELTTQFLRMDGGLNVSVFPRDIQLDGTNRAIRAFDATEIGFFVSNQSASVGAEGSIELPFTTTASPSDAQLNTAFGNFDGACGVSGSTAVIPRWQIKVNNNWNQVDMTNSN